MRQAFILLSMLGGLGAVEATSAAEVSVPALGAGYTAHDAPLGDPTELRIDLRGEVPARCRLASPPVLGRQLNFNRAGDVEARFGLDCNTPFSLRVRSGEGAFVTEDPREGVAPRIAYDVAIAIDTDAGLNPLGWCGADQLTDQPQGACVFGAGDGWSSGDATAIDRTGTMRLRWNAPGEGDEPVLGRYRDTIVVELAVRA